MSVVTVDDERLYHPCPCGGTSFRSLPALRFRTCTVIKCRSCGLLRTFPEPSPDALVQIYDGSVSQKYTPDRGAAFDEAWDTFAEDIVDSVERHRRPPGRLLDIGCDVGHVLREARRRGWSVEGLEINPIVASDVEQRLHVTVHQAPLEDGALDAASYSAIVISQVLEHVPRPREFLNEVFRLLEPGGVAFIGTPCFVSPIPLVLKRDRWYALLPSEHIWQFGPRSLPSLITDSGFEVVTGRRGCSRLWGDFSWRPKALARWTTYRAVHLARQGDFVSFVAQRPLA